MNYFSYTVALVLTLATSSYATPLQKGVIPRDAKWLVHLDVDNLRDSKVGTIVIKQTLAAPLAQLKTEMKVDGELILQKLHSITAFGTDFQAGPEVNGVLVLSGDEELQTIVEGLLAAQILQNSDGPIKKVQQTPFALYSVGGQVFISPGPAGRVVVSKSRQQVEDMRRVLAGKAEVDNAGEAFSGYAKVANTFFFLAVAEGFNENAALPAQARILKMADGARIVLGEKGDQLFLDIALKAKDAEVIQQIRQVLEGLKAVVALGQSENKELLELAQSTKVSSAEKVVTVNIEYPLSKAIGKLDGVSEQLQKHLGKPSHANRRKAKSNPSAKSDSPASQE